MNYFDIDACNFSTLKYMEKSPRHYKHARDVGRADSIGLLKGRAIHTAILEPDEFDARYPIYTGKTRRGKEWDAFREQYGNAAEILKIGEKDQIFAARDVVMKHPVASEIFKSGRAEQTMVWTDERTGLTCKARADWLTSNVLVDLKSTADVEARKFGALAARMLYHVQLAWYLDAAWATGWNVTEAKIVAVEIAAPHDVGVFTLSEDDLLIGRETYQKWLDRVVECQRTDQWPGRYDEEVPLSLPGYIFADEDLDDDSMAIISDETEEDAA
jgi:hypothetical protein